MNTDISFIIVNWNTRDLVLNCVRSIFETVRDFEYEIFVVDNGSADGSTEALRTEYGDRICLIANRDNLGFARANNQALAQARGRFAALVNSDAVLHPDTMKTLISFLDAHPRAAMAGPRMLGGDDREQNSFDNFPSLLTELGNKSLLRRLRPERFRGKSGTSRQAFEVDSLIGACIVVRTEAMRAVGLLDEQYFFFLEETDWCLRMRRSGWSIYHVPAATITHLQGQSKKRRPVMSWIEYYRSMYLYFKKHHSRTSYTALRILRVVKLCINLLLNCCALVLSLGSSRYREKTMIYAGILWWHVRLCPQRVGLRPHLSRTSGPDST